MTVDERVESATLQELIDWWKGDEPPPWASSTRLFFDKVARSLRQRGAEGVQFLKSQVESETIARKKALILRNLAHKDIADQDVIRWILNAFYDEDPRWKEFALGGLISIEYFPLNRSEVESLLNVDNKWLATAAMEYLIYAYPSEQTMVLRQGLQSTNPIMRAKACSEVGLRNINELKSEVVKLLKDEDQNVRIAAQTATELFEINDQRS